VKLVNIVKREGCKESRRGRARDELVPNKQEERQSVLLQLTGGRDDPFAGDAAEKIEQRPEHRERDAGTA
jgi:hypothetical protein